jgi:hypothetical protein
MKTILFATAMCVSSLAVAQPSTTAPQETTTTSATAQPTQTSPEPGTAATGQSTGTPAGPLEPATTTPSQGPMTPATGQSTTGPAQPTGTPDVIPDTSATTATVRESGVPRSTEQNSAAGRMSSANAVGSTAPAQAGNYPPCSRTVTDSCVQTNERGSSRRRRR